MFEYVPLNRVKTGQRFRIVTGGKKEDPDLSVQTYTKTPNGFKTWVGHANLSDIRAVGKRKNPVVALVQ